jgi:hypothetical protein
LSEAEGAAAGQEEAPAYHLAVHGEEIPVASSALRLLIGDEAHEPLIRGIARSVLERLGDEPDADGRLVLALSPPQMKILHSATRLLLNDLQREQADERAILWSILERLPDEHTMRAITLD